MLYEDEAKKALEAGTEEATQRGAAYAALALAQQINLLGNSLSSVVRALNARD